MAQKQEGALVEGGANVNLLEMASFNAQVQEAREFDFDSATAGIQNNTGVSTTVNPVTQALDLGKNYSTVIQSYMIGSGEAANLEQSTSDVRQMAYDFTARVVADLKNTFVAQASLSSQAAITADDLYFQYDVLAQSKSADPRDRGFARALATIGLESSETTENDKRLLAKVVPSTDSNFRRINKEHNVFVEDNLRLAA